MLRKCVSNSALSVALAHIDANVGLGPGWKHHVPAYVLLIESSFHSAGRVYAACTKQAAKSKRTTGRTRRGCPQCQLAGSVTSLPGVPEPYLRSLGKPLVLLEPAADAVKRTALPSGPSYARSLYLSHGVVWLRGATCRRGEMNEFWHKRH